ncbi:MAG: hypothetical protein GDA40_02255 [Rhodobacteraceae bacterium]|nr:hypothetical protein [Paracoccaceae bacterium]
MTIEIPMTLKPLISAAAVACVLGVSPSLAQDNTPAEPKKDPPKENAPDLEKDPPKENALDLEKDLRGKVVVLGADAPGINYVVRFLEGRMAHATFQTSVSGLRSGLFAPLTEPRFYSKIIGTKRGTRPSEGDLARWTGKMVAFRHGTPLEGKAEFFFNIPEDEQAEYGILSIFMHSIGNRDKNGSPNTRHFINFPHARVDRHGRFQQVFSRDSYFIQGHLYAPKREEGKPDPGHPEVAFTFRRYNINGAGGGVRVTDEADPDETQPKLKEWRAYKKANRAIKDIIQQLRPAGDTPPANGYGVSSDAIKLIPSRAITDAADETRAEIEYQQSGAEYDCATRAGGHATCKVREVGTPDSEGPVFRLVADMRRGDMTHIGEMNTIQLLDMRSTDLSKNIHRYGAWMEHAGFYLYTGLDPRPTGGKEVPTEVARKTFTLPFYGGLDSKSRPTVSATYKGAMVGTPATGQANHGDILVGNATVDFTAADARTGGRDSVKIGFSDIVNTSKGGVGHSKTSISFDPLSVDEKGRIGKYKEDEKGNGKIEPYDEADEHLLGRFYGPEQEEIAGEFLHSGVFGVFGAVAPVPEPDTGSEEPSPDKGDPGDE